MRRKIADKQDFWNIMGAAADIFEYRRTEIPESTGSDAWGFDCGFVGANNVTVSAEFSAHAVSGWGKDVVIVNAKPRDGGGWELTHEVRRS